MKKQFAFIIWMSFLSVVCMAGVPDTLSPVSKDRRSAAPEKDKQTTAHSPRKATVRSAILPGWGQYYNRKFWKIPLVYAALGTCTGLFTYNLLEYRDARDAYRFKLDNDPSNDALIKERFKPVDPESIRRYRNDVRRNVDYSVLAFLVCWGLNVVDATVDGHLKSFEVSENLSLKLQPGFHPATQSTSLGLHINWHPKSSRKSK